MSSAGQIVGGVVGGVVGIAFPVVGFALGASIGMAIGGYIDPPKGPKGRPPSASDLAVQTATYGAPLSDGYGTYGTLGNVFWVEGNTLRAEEHKAEGGKGGGATGPSTYDIFGTFAVGFGEGEIDGYGRIWFGSKLVCDFRSSDVGTIIATTENGGSITLYTGSASQLPDPRIQADMGAANTPAYRGLHYIVVSDWPMADYGNSLMGLQVKAEIVRTATFDQYARRVYVPDDLIPRTTNLPGASSTEYGYYNPRIESGVLLVDKSNTEVGYEYAYTWAIDFEGNLLSQTPCVVEAGQFGYIGAIAAGLVTFDGYFTGTFKVAGTEFKLKTSDQDNTCHGMAVGADGRLYVLERVAGAWLFNIYDGSDLSLVSSGTNYSIRLADNIISVPCIPGSPVTFCIEADGVNLWTAQEGGGYSNFLLCGISPSGDLTTTHDFATAFLGTYGTMSAIAAKDGLCFGVNSGGGFYVFDRNLIIGTPTVPLADIISARCLKTGLLDAADIDVTAITKQVRGYKVPTVAPVRASLEPLQAAWPFDVIPKGYKLKFVPRAGASVATIDIGELGCVAGNDKPSVRITSSREMDTQLPREVQVTYLDVGREYDPNTGPGAKRWNTDAVNVENLELAIVMNATEAAQTEEVLLYMRWLERHDVSFVLPPTRNNLEAADVITITSPTATYELRLTAINYLPDGRLECSAKLNNAAVYTSTAVAQEALSPVQVLTYPGASVLQLLDIPCVDSAVMDAPGMLTAVTGYSSSWPGCTLFRSDDEGQTWIGVQGFNAPGCTMGLATNAIGATSRYTVDHGSMLNVRLLAGDLSSVTQDAMLNGANHFAYGAAGRWEIIAAQTCTIQGDGTYTLSNLMRGRFGTEQYMPSHIVGDSVVLLDTSSVRFVGLNIASLNINRKWRPVTKGRSLDSTSETVAAYTGVNLKPLSPVDLSGHIKYDSLDYVISWTPRSRTGVEPFSGMATPLGETSSSYEVEIWNSTYTTLIRTISGLTSPTATYAATQQVADFGVEQQTLYVKIYQLSSTVGRGFPMASSITRSAESDQFAASVTVGMHFNGANNSTTFTEVTGKVVTAIGDAKILTSQSKFNGSSLYCDGTGDGISIPNSGDVLLGSGDFTAEVFVRLSDITSVQSLFGVWGASGAFSWQLFHYSGNIQFSFSTDGTTQTNAVISTSGISANTWVHVEVVRSGANIYVFVDGVQSGSTYNAGSSSFYNSSSLLGIGIVPSNSYGPCAAYFQDFRLTKAARHTANFTPPVASFRYP